ncbi:MAG: GDSL-type esterase/lipase family protein [Eikenella sp.]|nr:GDSL-type esterase/lipase family protein [Eikenella sp.]
MPTYSRRQFLALSAAALLAACSRHAPAYAALPRGSRVLALGDSLTAGYGAAAEAAYPAQLARLTGWQVDNGGVSGDTSAQALARLPALLRTRPQLVLIGIGGNDFLRRLPETDTRRHIGRLLENVRQAGSQPLLIAMPKVGLAAAFGHLSDHPLYAELAAQYRVPLLRGVWSDILSDDALKSDAIHANAAGYRLFAERLADFLQQQGFR